MSDLDPTYFPTPEDLRKWFTAHHADAKELLVGYYKKGSKVQSIDWPQSVDQALCFGWIDGVRRSIDGNRYCIRFTPRKKNSIWSAVNLKRIEELDQMGLLTDAGRKVWMARNPDQQNKYSFEQAEVGLSPAYTATFQQHTTAWERWEGMAPSYRKAAIWWVMSAKQPATQLSRLQTLIDNSAQGERIPAMRVRKGKP